MFETNDDIVQIIKQTIHDYYMGYIRQKLNHFLANGKETEISNHIMQFLDAQIDTGNPIIAKDDIIRILNSVLLDSDFASSNMTSEQSSISYCFPNVADITIEDGSAVYLTEKLQTPFNGTEEKYYYLYVSHEYYDKNIVDIENKIKKFEKTFSRHDFKNFEEKYNQDLLSKQYELESAKVYESASNQIELKKQKFNSVSQKMINEYGKKYEEIMSKDISNEEKRELTHKLFDETKTFDEKNHQAILRLNSEYEKLTQNFQGKVQNSKTIYSQMQNLHLFDKNRYFEDMMASVNPELRDLYKKRYLLNSYRIAHNEPIYSGKSNIFISFLGNVINNIKHSRAPLMLGPHFDRDTSSRRYLM